MQDIKLSDISKNMSLDLSGDDVISLRKNEQDFNLDQAKLDLQGRLAKPFAWAFIFINIAVIFGIGYIWIEEWATIKSGTKIERLITPEVIMSIVGATTIQLGTIMLTLTRGLFSPKS